MPTGALTLAAVAERTDLLVVACSRCTRTGRYRLDKLIVQRGPLMGVPELLRLLSADCQKHQSLSAYDLCGIHCPDLAELFGV